MASSSSTVPGPLIIEEETNSAVDLTTLNNLLPLPDPNPEHQIAIAITGDEPSEPLVFLEFPDPVEVNLFADEEFAEDYQPNTLMLLTDSNSDAGSEVSHEQDQEDDRSSEDEPMQIADLDLNFNHAHERVVDDEENRVNATDEINMPDDILPDGNATSYGADYFDHDDAAPVDDLHWVSIINVLYLGQSKKICDHPARPRKWPPNLFLFPQKIEKTHAF